MSREAKHRKDHRRRERDFRQKRNSRAYEQVNHRFAHVKGPFTTVEFNIAFEPIEDKTPPMLRLREHYSEEELEDLLSDLTDDPRSAIDRLVPMVDEHPDVPMLFNWLSAAYNAIGDTKKADEIIRSLYDRFPMYLFALVNRCMELLGEGKVDEVTKILDRRFVLKALYPDRDVFHITEVMAFSHLLVQYFVKVNQIDAAEVQLDIMERFCPEDPQTVSARFALLCARAARDSGFLKRSMLGLLNAMARR